MSKPTDGDVLNELFTGEFDAEPPEEQDRRLSGSFAQGQARLARAIRYATELARPHLDSKEPV
jgi:hypothetical protein